MKTLKILLLLPFFMGYNAYTMMRPSRESRSDIELRRYLEHQRIIKAQKEERMRLSSLRTPRDLVMSMEALKKEHAECTAGDASLKATCLRAVNSLGFILSSAQEGKEEAKIALFEFMSGLKDPSYIVCNGEHVDAWTFYLRGNDSRRIPLVERDEETARRIVRPVIRKALERHGNDIDMGYKGNIFRSRCSDVRVRSMESKIATIVREIRMKKGAHIAEEQRARAESCNELRVLLLRAPKPARALRSDALSRRKSLPVATPTPMVRAVAPTEASSDKPAGHTTVYLTEREKEEAEERETFKDHYEYLERQAIERRKQLDKPGYDVGAYWGGGSVYYDWPGKKPWVSDF